ncbi:YfhO family protein [Geobacter sp. AOG2]|uniref:YfhO family protein n=1 Tax=Geobacter sp. AOG2 TaxID=1566347 RepID=UPI001CC3873C|nr:YfhO family protein [Geobacter sp. AOG2]GFE62125.1 hypothetical protein AOG2_27130 [Geobacter sp. AOG2]
MDALFLLVKSKKTAAFFCLCLTTAVLFWPVFFQGKVIVPGDFPNSNPFLFIGNTPPPPPQNTLLSDEIEQFYVWHRIAAETLQVEGHIPLWNPYIFTGQPLVANAQSSLFYPPNLLLRILSPGKVATIRVIFNLLFAGFFTFLFCRALNISNKGSLVSAITFAFSGPTIVWVGFPLANVLVCLPFLMWAGEKILLHRSLFRTAMLGAGMGLALLGGHPETTFQILAIFSLYFLARVVFLKSSLQIKGGLLGSFLLAVMLGAVISGIQLLPFLDFMRQSSTFARGGRGGGMAGNLFYSPEWVANLTTAITFICPNFFGNPLDHSYIWPFTNFQNYNEQSVYFGLVPLALAGGALFTDSKRLPLLIITVLSIFCIGVAWHLPCFEAISHLPVFSMAPSKRFRLPFVFLAAVMAGFGYDILLNRMRSGQGEKKQSYSPLAIPFATILFFILIIALKVSVANDIPPGTFGQKILDSVFAFRQWRTYLPLAIAVALSLGYLFSQHFVRVSRLFPGALIALTAFELCALGWDYNPVVKEADILPAAPAVELLKKWDREPYRILTTDGYFYPNYGAAYGIADVAGYDAPVYQSFSDLYLAQGGRSFGEQIDSRQQWDPSWPLVNFLNVKYVISPRDLPPDKFKLLFENRYFAIYENLHVLPRVFMVYDSEVVSDRTAMLDKMLTQKIDFRGKVFLDEPPQARLVAVPGAPAKYSVKQARNTTDEVDLTVSSDRPGILVMSDLYTPDWHARVDGNEVKLYRANYAYRAVLVPAGQHTVSFRYLPKSYVIGVAMTMCGVAVFLIACGVGLRRRRTDKAA